MRKWGSFLAVALLALGLSAGLRASGPISVVMEDGTVVKGTLLGVDQGTATLQRSNGKTVDLAVDRVKKAFDADGNAVALNGASATVPKMEAKAAKAAVDADADDEDTQVVPRDRHYRGRRSSNSLRKRRVAGNVLFWTGTGLLVGGAVALVYGANQMGDATSTYYNGYGYNSSGQYVGYTLPGEPGYYTADQYNQYYYGEDWAVAGVVVGAVGIAGMVTGLIIRPSGRQIREDALLHYEDGKFSLGLPPVTVDARLHSPRATLATVQF